MPNYDVRNPPRRESDEGLYLPLKDYDEVEKESLTSKSSEIAVADPVCVSWYSLREKPEEEIIEEFEKIKPEDIDINATFPGSKNTLLHEAAMIGKLKVLKMLIKYKPELNIQNMAGDTPVICTVKECLKHRDKPEKICEEHLSCLKTLLEAKANLSVKNRADLTVLSYATMCPEEKREAYLATLLPINGKKNFATGLYQALESRSDIECLEELKCIRQDIQQKSLQEFMFGEYTLLQAACVYGMVESAKFLLDLEADPDFAPIIPRTPIQLACVFLQPEILQLLVDKNESLLEVKTGSKRNLIHLTVKETTDPEKAIECLKILLKHGVKKNINDPDKYGRTPLHYAVLHNRYEGAVELLNNGANTNIQDKYRRTPLHYAVLHNRYEGAVELLNNGANTNIQDKYRRTPLHYAVLHNRDECTLELLNNGANIDILDKWQQSPLMHISKSVFETYLDNMILDDSNDTMNETKKKTGEPEENLRSITFDFKNLFRKKIEPKDTSNPKESASYYYFPTEVLCKIKETKRLEQLIEHPVLNVIIYFKWFHVKAIFYLYLLLYFFFCSLFTWYIYSTEDFPFHKVPAKPKQLQSKKLNFLSTIKSLIEEADIKLYLIIPILITIFFLLFFESLKIGQKKMKYLSDLDNLLRLTVMIFAVLVMFCLNTPIFSPYCPQLKAVSILLTWFELFLVVGKYPSASYYVMTFRSASVNLFKFLSLHVILLIGFAFSFHTLFRSSTTDNIFTDPSNAFFKTIVMLTSEFDAENIPFDEYSGISHLIFIVYIFIITIVLLNLMVAIALKQVKKMGKNRHLYESLAQIDYIKHFEDIFSENFVIKDIYNFFSQSNCCKSNHYNVRSKEGSNKNDMKLKVSQKGSNQEFSSRLIFKRHPKGKVEIKDLAKKEPNNKKWFRKFNFCKIFEKCHDLHHSVIENAQEIVSKRISKSEESEKENSNFKADFELLKNELIELRRLNEKESFNYKADFELLRNELIEMRKLIQTSFDEKKRNE